MADNIATARSVADIASLYLPSWIDGYPDALLILDSKLVVLWANERARKLVGAHPDLTEHEEQLSAQTKEDQSRLAMLISSLATHKERSVVLFGKTRARAIVADAWRVEGQGAGLIAGVRLHWLRRRSQINLALLGAIHQLTKEERSTVGDILLGQTVMEIAARTGKAESTVRTHLKRVYAKMEIGSREQLFAECAAFFTPRQ